MIFMNSNLDHNPKFIEAQGAYLIDQDGKFVFDTWLGSGTLIFGHEKNFNTKEKLLPSGPSMNQLFFDNINACVDFEIGAVGFQTSGSSAVSRAIRLARAVTNKNIIVVIGSFWHGSENEFLFKNNKSMITSGLAANSHAEVEWYPTLGQAIAGINVERTAAIMVEPYQGADPGNHLFNNLVENWRENLREHNILLICDEIITGFRERYGSCDISRLIDPDITLFGKAIGGGFPVGVVIVNNVVFNEYEFQLPFWGGTFSASPVQLTAVEAALNRIKELNFGILKNNLQKLIKIIDKHISGTGLEVKTGCNFARIAKEMDVTARSFVDSNNAFDLLRISLIEDEGIFIGNNGLVFPSIYEYMNQNIVGDNYANLKKG